MKSKIEENETKLVPISEMTLRSHGKSRKVPQLPDHGKKRNEKSRAENFLTLDEYNSLQRYLLNNGTQRNRNVMMTMMLYETGARVSDMLNIRPKDIDFTRRAVNVYVQKSGVWSLKPLSMELAYALSIYINENKIQPEEQVVDLTRTQVWKIIKDAGMAQLKRRVTPHTLRHSTAMAIRNNGGSDDDVKDALDHSSVEVTEEFYAEADLETKRGILIRAGVMKQ